MDRALGDLTAMPAFVFLAIAAAALLAAVAVILRSMPPEEFARRIFKQSDLDGIRPYFSGSRYEAALNLLLGTLLISVGLSAVSLAIGMFGRWLLPGFPPH